MDETTLFCSLFICIESCEAWTHALREELRLKVFENMTRRRIFGPKRDANGNRRRLHSEELHNLYRSPNIVRVIKSKRLRWSGHVAIMKEVRSAFNIIKDNIRMDLKEIDINTRNLINSAQDRAY